ncbi:Acg family FMN-binding oxidoreductase [Paenibacillus flagellatus]|nr:hypothetical protein [Paenibacillus flagellatus]
MWTSLLLGVVALVFVAFAGLLIASGIFATPRYLEPWSRDYHRQFDDPRIRLAAHGLLAANGHNMQAWKVRLAPDDPNVFYLFVDSTRLTGEVDPYARQTLVSAGTFLEYVRVAGEKLGYMTAITLFPDGSYDEGRLAESMNVKPVAQVALTGAEPEDDPLYEFLFRPDTNRSPYEDKPLTDGQIDRLRRLTDDSELSLNVFQDQEHKKRLGTYAVEGAVTEAAVHRISLESAALFRANEYEKNKYRYGFSLEGQGLGGLMKHAMQGLMTAIPSINSEKATADLFVKSTRDAVEHTPAYAMIFTKGNTRAHQVKAGMLYSRLVLTAHRMGLAVQPPSQVLEEYAEMKPLYDGIHREYAPESGTIQLFVRIGEPTREARRTMRRDVMDIVENRP